jgi:hypothetical protein
MELHFSVERGKKPNFGLMTTVFVYVLLFFLNKNLKICASVIFFYNLLINC